MFELSGTVNSNCITQSPIRKIMEMADPINLMKWNINPSDAISFAGGWVNHSAPEELREEYIKIVSDKSKFHKIGAYSPTEGDPELRICIAEMEKIIYGITGLTADNIVIGQSSTQLLSGILVTICNPKDKILVFDPTYANYLEQVFVSQRQKDSIVKLKVFDNQTWTYMKNEEEFLFSYEEIINNKKPRAILFSSPDNPTGQIIPDHVVKRIIQIAENAGVFVIMDNAYKAQYFVPEMPKHFSFSPIDFQNLILINSNSKWSRGLGRRLGWIECDKQLAKGLKSVQQATILCPDTLHQAAFAKYIESTLDNGALFHYLESNRKKYQAAAEFTTSCIEKYLGMRYLIPQGGLYTIIDVGMDCEKFVEDVLMNTGVIFVPGKGFGETLANGIRVSFGPLVEDFGKIEEGLSRVNSFLRKYNNYAPPLTKSPTLDIPFKPRQTKSISSEYRLPPKYKERK